MTWIRFKGYDLRLARARHPQQFKYTKICYRLSVIGYQNWQMSQMLSRRDFTLRREVAITCRAKRGIFPP